MNVIGFDTATSATAAALALDGSAVAERRDDPPAGAHPGHATRLLGFAEELLADADLGWAALDRIAVGVGPGTFTGLRVGIATARGLAQALATELVGVSSLAALAAPALADRALAGEAETRPGVLGVIDARRGEAFVGAYELADDGDVAELLAPRALAPGDLDAAIADIATVTGASRRWLAVGDGAIRYRAELERAGARVPPRDSGYHRVRAAAICAAGMRAPRSPEAPLDAILPDYRRRPDAELALRGAGGEARRQR
jgi:tRNA threonylcarbamoyladenosine biosynthesis protein TsaB